MLTRQQANLHAGLRPSYQTRGYAEGTPISACAVDTKQGSVRFKSVKVQSSQQTY